MDNHQAPRNELGDTTSITSAIAKSLDFITNLGTRNADMRYCFELAQEACKSQAPVLIIGENGTGKSLLAQSIHYASPMGSGPCVTVDCGSIDKNGLEAEIFGISYDYEETSFQEGALNRAAGGTLIIDDVECLPLTTQSILLKAFEERRYRLVGSSKTHSLRTRIVSTSESDLAEKAAGGLFLEDLIYSLGEVTLRLPPLRARMEDIPALVEKGIQAANRRYGKKVAGLSKTAMDFLINYEFPGNIRELNRLLNRAVSATNRDTIFVEDLGVVLDSPDADSHLAADATLLPLFEMEKRHIGMVLDRVNWNKKAAARILHVTQPFLQRKIQIYSLEHFE